MSAPQPGRESLASAVAARRRWALDVLGDLVRQPTVLGNEEPGQRSLAVVLEGLGYDVRWEPIRVDRIRDLPGFSPIDWELEGKPNLVAVHDPGEGAGRSLAFNGHIDVVSAEPLALWSTPPFSPTVLEAEGETWVQGRGAGDMKGGTVSYLWALAALQDLGLEPASRLVCQSPVEEECTGNGTLALLERGYGADACVIPEPFGETLLQRQVGVLWFQVRVVGRTTHVLGAGRGVNAIEKSTVIISALRDLETEMNRPEVIPPEYEGIDHPLNLNVGTIRGGDWASTVAGECLTRYRLGLFPGERCEDLMRRVEARVMEVADADPWLRDNPPAVEYVGFRAEGCHVDAGCALLGALGRAHAQVRGAPPERLVATCTTDVRFFNLYAGIDATCYGPQAVNIHGVDEGVSVDSMQRTAEVLLRFTSDWCGTRTKPRPAHSRSGDTS